jgi:RNA polymerase sigma-70 factor (ECF subfamily)
MARAHLPGEAPPAVDRAAGGVETARPRRPAPAVEEPALDDAELVALAKADRQVFALLYRRYVRDVYQFCDRRLADREAAEDATATIFLRALEKIESCRDGAAFRSWLFTIAYRVVNDDYRARRPVVPWEAAGWVADGRPSPEDLAVAGDERRRIATLLGQLKPDERDLISLRLQGLNDKEIAAVLGRRHGTIRNKQSKVLGRLRQLLGIATGKEAGHVEP